MSSFPYVATSNVFNTADFLSLDDALTIETANKLYLSINDGIYITGITAGIATANKALVVDGSLNISGINQVSSSYLKTYNTSSTPITSSSTGNDYGLHLHSVLSSSNGVYSGSSISFNNSSADQVPLAAIYLDKIGSGNGELVFATRNGSTCIERLRITSSSINFTNIGVSSTATITGNLTFTSSANKTIMRDSTITSSTGIEFYDNTFTSLPLINFKTGNNNNPHFAQFCGYLNDNDGTGAYPANGVPFEFDQFMNSSFDSGFRISAINVSQATNNNANVGIWSRNYTIPHIIAHDRFNQTLIKPTSTQLTSQITGYDIVMGSNTVFSGGGINEMRGNATVFSLRNTTGGSGDRISYIMSHGLSPSSVEWEISVGGTTHPVAPSGMYWYSGGNYRMILTSGGRLGVGGANPRCGLEVSGSVSQTTVPFGTNTFSYNVSNNTWTIHGGGPFSYSVCAWFNGNIYVNNSIYNASDRRLKDNIKKLDIDIEHYKKINPVSYTYKNETNTQIGFIAQEMRDVCGEAVSYADNENLKVEKDGDIEGVQMNIDYKQITVMNTAIIKKLIDKIEKLEKKILDKV